jgi:hypothetical protein
MYIKIIMNDGTEEWKTLKARDAKSGESYDWWEPVIDGLNRVERLKADYRKRFAGVDEVIDEATSGIIDLEDNIAAQEAALKEAFGEI